MRWTMGVAPDRVERMMGHAIPGVTGTHYDKPSAEQFVETVAEAFARRPFVAKERSWPRNRQQKAPPRHVATGGLSGFLREELKTS